MQCPFLIVNGRIGRFKCIRMHRGERKNDYFDDGEILLEKMCKTENYIKCDLYKM